METAPLLWGEPVDHLEPPADIIIASDVIYAHDTVGALTDTLLSLCGDSTMIILGYELRAGSTGWVQVSGDADALHVHGEDGRVDAHCNHEHHVPEFTAYIRSMICFSMENVTYALMAVP